MNNQTEANRDCAACNVPIATGDCRHVLIRGDQATMTVTEWRRVTDELSRLRTAEALGGNL